MRRCLHCLFFSFLLAAGCQQPPVPPPPPARIVAYGDSITRGYGVPAGTGWVELLATRLPGKIVNAGGDGNTSREGLARLERDVLAHQPALVLVEFGGNDAVEGERHVPVEEFEQNLRSIHHQVTARGGRIVLLTFPPVIDARHAFRDSPYFLARGGIDREVDRYRQRTRAVAQSLRVPLFDLDRYLRERDTQPGVAPAIAPDGVHLTIEGNQAVAGALVRFLAEHGR
jgi:lysophospholipase L1-like esterase